MPQRRTRFAAEPFAQAADKTGLADARLAGEQDDLSLALLRPLPPVQQQCQFLVAPHQRGSERAVSGVEPALGGPLAEDDPSPNRLSEAFQAHRVQIAVGEQITEQAVCGLGNDHMPRLRYLLQPRREVRGLTD